MVGSFSTAKAILLLAAATLSHRVHSPPTPPAKQASISKFGEGDELRVLIRWIPIVGQTAVWLTTACEILVTVADAYPSSSLARVALNPLTFGSPSKAHNIRLSTSFIVGWLLLVLGGALRFLCYHQLGPQFTYRLTIVEGHTLVTTGPYAIVRHPSYTAWITFIFGVLTVQMSPGSWVAECGMLDSVIGRIILAVWTVYNLYIVAVLPARTRREDNTLKRQFGDQWVQWSKRTPYKLVPGLY